MSRVPTLEEFGEVVSLIYEAGADASLWPKALLASAELIGAKGGAFQMHRKRENIASGIEVNFDPAISREYFAYYQHNCPWIASWFETIKSGNVALGADLCDRTILERSEAYNDFYRRLDISDTCVLPFLVGENNAWANLNCGRRKGRFTEGDRKTAQLLLPHFSRALGFQERFGTAFQRGHALGVTLDRLDVPVLILDMRRRILYSNTAADPAVAGDGWWKVASGRFAFFDAGADNRLTAVLKSLADARSAVPVMIDLGAAPPRYAVIYPCAEQHGGPFGAIVGARHVIVYLPSKAGQRSGIDSLLALYGLTEVEKEMVLALIDGQSIPDYAEKHGLSRETARWRSKRIYFKMGVRGQSDLLRTALSTAPPVRLGS